MRTAHRPVDDVRIFRMMMIYGLIGALILAGFTIAYGRAVPPPSGLSARIVGVYNYDWSSRRLDKTDRRVFTSSEAPAVTVDYSELPDDTVAVVIWESSRGRPLRAEEPVLVGSLRTKTISYLLAPTNVEITPGRYYVTVDRGEGDRLVEILARTLIEVKPG